MSVIGILLMMVGFGSAVYGIYENYSFQQLDPLSQGLLELVDRGASSAGLIWIILGVIVFAVGLATLVIGYRKQCTESK